MNLQDATEYARKQSLEHENINRRIYIIGCQDGFWTDTSIPHLDEDLGITLYNIYFLNGEEQYV